MKRVAKGVVQLADRAGFWLHDRLASLAWAFWRFMGRIGLAIRRILSTLIFRPFSFVFRKIINFFRGLWRITGRMGLAGRGVLSAVIWRPLLAITSPLRWLYSKTLYRPFSFVSLSLQVALSWLFQATIALIINSIKRFGRFTKRKIREGWQANGPFRYRQRRKMRSRWLLLKARMRVALSRPPAPNTVILAPRLPSAVRAPRRLNRVATAFISASVILLVGFITTQVRQPEPTASAGELSPEPQPAATVTTPRIDVETLNLTRQVEQAVDAVQLTPWPTPDTLGSGGSVAFTIRRNGNSDIYVLTIGRPEPVRLTADPADDVEPAWSPDGRELAFSSRRDGNWEIYVLNLQSGETRRITNYSGFDGGPSWSPDGQWLVFESYRDNNLDLYIVRADGENTPIRLTENPAQDFSPVWAPGGRHIAFTSWRSGNQDIFIMSLDTASDQTAENITVSPDRYEDHPTFEGQDRYLAYDDGSTGYELVYVTPLEGYRPAERPVTVGQGRHPSWSPDGSSLLYAYDSGGQSHLIAGSVDAWSVAPQAYTTDGYVDDLAWSAVTLLPDLLEEQLQDVAAAQDTTLYTENVSQLGSQELYFLWEIDVDAPLPYLSERVDQSFDALRDRVIAEAGWDLLGQLDNMYLSLDDKPLPGQPAQSWSYAGRAFDFNYLPALADNPQVEVVREDQGSETFWRVYLRTAEQDGSMGQPLRQVPWDFRARFGFDPQYYDQGGKTKDEIPAGYYLDFTALAADYGWERVPAVERWHTFFQGIRYWHFENHQGLTWEEAMLEIYTPDELEDTFNNQ
jgi:TolB protein